MREEDQHLGRSVIGDLDPCSVERLPFYLGDGQSDAGVIGVRVGREGFARDRHRLGLGSERRSLGPP